MFIINKKTLNSDNTPAKKAVFSKRIDGTYYVVEAIPDTGRLSVISAYKNKASGVSDAPAADPSLTSDNELPNYNASDDIVSQPEDIVNKNISDIYENTLTQAIRSNNARGAIDNDNKSKSSIDTNFKVNYDKWVNNGRQHRNKLIVGYTSDAFKSIGVPNRQITWDTSKINTSLKKHPYLNDETMKQIPDIIDNPIIIMGSKQSKSRLTAFGEVYDPDGLPIMAVIELLPTNQNRTVVLDEIKLVSTHSRKSEKNPFSKTQTQNLINSSDIYYIDPNKNRTDNWLTLNRLQLPLGINQYGSIKRIPHLNPFVKVF